MVSCRHDDQSSDEQLTEEIDQHGLSGDPSTGASTTNIEDPLPQLGMKLFFTQALGGQMDSACVTCHHPMLGGGDNLSLPIGVGAINPDMLGPGRQHSPSEPNYDNGSPLVPRNAPTTFNIGLWKDEIFWDGRLETVVGGITTPASTSFGDVDPNAVDLPSAQARFPVTSVEEMRSTAFEVGTSLNSVWSHLQARIGDYGVGTSELTTNNWATEFEAVFGAAPTPQDLVTFDRIVAAIGAYERSQVFVNNPWKAYVQGDKNAISPAAKRGALLFYRTKAEGGANCASCHSGDFFTDEGFHTIATPQIGHGKGDGPNGDDDFGRFKATGDTNDLYEFRTPSLLNVEATGPWGRVGSYTTLESIVRHHLDPQVALDNYDYTQLDPTIQTTNTVLNTQLHIDKLNADRVANEFSLENVALTDNEVNDLIEFLKALTDPCVKSRICMSAWIPDGADTNPDGLRINAVDGNGDLL